MPDRRGFIKIAGVGAGAAVAATALNAAPAGAAAAPEQAAPAVAGTAHAAAAGTPTTFVAYVEDLAAGQISVMSGEHEVSVVDHRLAAELAATLRGRSTRS